MKIVILNLRPNKEPKATEHIKEMIEMTTSLINKNLPMSQRDMYIFPYHLLKNMENYQTKI